MINPGTRSNALAGSVTATVDDASALWYNPAGIQLAGDLVKLAGHNNELQTDWQPLYDYRGDAVPLSVVPNLFSFVPATVGTERLVWGIGVTQPFFRNVGLPSLGTQANVEQAIYDMAFGAGLGIGEAKTQTLSDGRERRSYPVRIGGTFDLIFSSARLDDVPGIPTSEQRRGAQGATAGLGVMFEHLFDAPAGDEDDDALAVWVRSVSAGGRYRHRAGLDFDSTLSIENAALAIATIDFPATASMGLGLDIAFADASILSLTGAYDVIFYEDAGPTAGYRDAASFAFGIEFQPAGWGPISGLRGGYRSTEHGGPGLPAADSIYLGIGFVVGPDRNSEFNLSYQYLDSANTHDPILTINTGSRHVLGAGITVRF